MAEVGRSPTEPKGHDVRKIPTLFVRDPDDRKHVLNEVTPGCEWVIEGDGIATRKYDGTCCMVRDGELYARREVKSGKTPPEGFEEVEHDETTGKTVGWVRCEDTAEYARHKEAFVAAMVNGTLPQDGTYELCGPKVNGNPEGFAAHRLVAHDDAEVYVDAPLDYEGLRHFLLSQPAEGIVWHHPDGRMAKLKKRDFQ